MVPQKPKYESGALLYVGEHGDVQTVRPRRNGKTIYRILLVTTICLATALAWGYHRSLEKEKKLKAEVQRLAEEVKSLREDNNILLARLIGMQTRPKETISGEVTQATSPGKPPLLSTENPDIADHKPKPVSKQNDEANTLPKHPALPPEPTKPKTTAELKQIAVEGIKVRYDRNTSTMVAQFKVVNTAKGRKPVSGYAFLVLETDKTAEAAKLVLPGGEWLKEQPQKIRSGYAFTIVNYKEIRFKPHQLTNTPEFTLATVFVYGADGTLLSETSTAINPPSKG